MIYLYQKMQQRLKWLQSGLKSNNSIYEFDKGIKQQEECEIAFLEETLKEYDELRERAKELGKELAKINALMKDDYKGNLR